MSQPSNRRDLLTFAAAMALLLAGALGWWLWNERARERRDAVLAGVPEFPAPGQVVRRRPPATRAPQAAPAPISRSDAGAPPPAARAQARDKLNAFALAPSKSVAVLQVNAILNSPLFARFKECAPEQFRDLEAGAAGLGIDLERDVDRVAMVPGGMAVSGFFEGKPLAEQLAGRSGSASARSYRGETLWTTANGGCVAQLGTLLVLGRAEECPGLVDRALDGNPGPDAAEQLYGDLFARTDLTALRGRLGSELGGGERELFGALVESLDGLTLRANVWDQVALTVDGDPSDPKQADDLARMARGAISLARTQIGDDNVELQALSELAKVRSEDGKLKLDLALPADTLFDKLHLPCPGKPRGAGR